MTRKMAFGEKVWLRESKIARMLVDQFGSNFPWYMPNGLTPQIGIQIAADYALHTGESFLNIKEVEDKTKVIKVFSRMPVIDDLGHADGFGNEFGMIAYTQHDNLCLTRNKLDEYLNNQNIRSRRLLHFDKNDELFFCNGVKTYYSDLYQLWGKK
ncbi:MAG: hypothetical protein WCK29_01345 [archaeon]